MRRFFAASWRKTRGGVGAASETLGKNGRSRCCSFPKGYLCRWLLVRPLRFPQSYHLQGLVPPFFTTGYQFCTWGKPWQTMGAARRTHGGRSPIFIDFGIVLAPHVERFWGTRGVKSSFLYRFVFRSLFAPVCDSKSGRPGLSKPGVRIKIIAKKNFSQKSFLIISGSAFGVLPLRTGLKIDGFSVL